MGTVWVNLPRTQRWRHYNCLRRPSERGSAGAVGLQHSSTLTWRSPSTDREKAPSSSSIVCFSLERQVAT